MAPKKVAVIFEGDSDDRKGLFNAAVERYLHLKEELPYTVDLIIIQILEGPLTRLIRKTPKRKAVEEVTINGVPCKSLWIRSSLIDPLFRRINLPPISKILQSRRLASLFEEYDFICFHSWEPLLDEIESKFHTPYSVTWHGSDTHTKPFANKYVFRKTAHAIENANLNLYVGKGLMQTSEKISTAGRFSCTENSEFFRYTSTCRQTHSCAAASEQASNIMQDIQVS